MNYKYILTAVLIVAVFSGTASAWLSGYDHRMAITVNNGEASPLSHYQFNFTNDTNVLVAAGHMQASGADCRITDAFDNLIPFWNETAFNAADTKIWANATTLEVGSNMFYLYYGNSGASSVASGTDTFVYFDDYNNVDLGEQWVQYANNPVVSETTGFGERFDDGYVYDPLVIRNGTEEYIMYYTGGHDAVVTCRDKVGIQTSSDLYNWTPYNGSGSDYALFNCGGAGDFDIGRVWFSGSVIWENETTWKMWYIGDSDTSTTHVCRVGYATSTNGYNWTKYTGNSSYLGAIFEDMDGESSGGMGVEYCTILQESETDYKMWYSIYAKSKVKYATSTNGLNWTIQNGGNAVHTSLFGHVEKIGSTYYAWTADDGDNIDVYTSTNCIDWTKQGGAQIEATISGWDSGQIHTPRLFHENDIWYAFFSGWHTGVTTDCRIGVATLNKTIPLVDSVNNASLLSYTNDVETTHTFTGGALEISKQYIAASYGGVKIDNITNLNSFAAHATVVPLTDTNPSNFMGFKTKNGAAEATPSFYFYEGGPSGMEVMRLCDNNTVLNSSNPVWLDNEIYYLEWIYDNKSMTVKLTGYNSSTITGTANNTIPSDFYLQAHTGSASGINKYLIDNFFYRKFSTQEPTSQLGAAETQGGGAYNITLPLGWSIIGWTDTTPRTAHYMGGLIGSNCSYVVERNRTTGSMVYHNMAGPEGENNFAIERGWGYYVSTTAETLWERDA